jgi:hypothetical protein
MTFQETRSESMLLGGFSGLDSDFELTLYTNGVPEKDEGKKL